MNDTIETVVFSGGPANGVKVAIEGLPVRISFVTMPEMYLYAPPQETNEIPPTKRGWYHRTPWLQDGAAIYEFECIE